MAACIAAAHSAHMLVLTTAETRHWLTSWYAEKEERVVSMLSSIENAFCSVGEGRGEEDNRLFGTVWRRALLHTVHTC